MTCIYRMKGCLGYSSLRKDCVSSIHTCNEYKRFKRKEKNRKDVNGTEVNIKIHEYPFMDDTYPFR